MPGVALLSWRHMRPVLHLFKSATTTLALWVTLTGRANCDTRRINCGVVPA